MYDGSDGKFWRHDWRKNCWDLVLKWGGFIEQNDPHPPNLSISFRSAWGIHIWISGLKELIDTDKFAQYLHELSRSHWEQNPAWCFSKSLLPSHSLSIFATNSIMPVSRMVSLFSPVKNCSHWPDLVLAKNYITCMSVSVLLVMDINGIHLFIT